MTGFGDSQIVYRDLGVGAWGRVHLIVGGEDVTFLRGKPAQIGGYQLTDPYGYGPADFDFPQITSLEVDAWGTGDLSWFQPDAGVALIQVKPDGTRGRTLWRGHITTLTPSNAGTQVHCDGEASARLKDQYLMPALVYQQHDVGELAWYISQFSGLTMTPRLGPTTGMVLDNRSRSGDCLSVMDGLLADTLQPDGSQYTYMPNGDGSYGMRPKDMTTVAFTIWNGAQGVDPSLTRDVSTELTTVYGAGIQKDGAVFSNEQYPEMIQGPTPTFPGAMSLGDSGPNVTVAQNRLIGASLLDVSEPPGTFDAATQQAVKDLQDKAGLSQTGTIDAATWDKLFDVTVTGQNLAFASSLPYAQDPSVRMWNLTSSGALAAKNPAYKPGAHERAAFYDHGSAVSEGHVRQWSKNHLARVRNGKNFAGTITLTSDVAVGDVMFGGAITPMSRLDIVPGTNLNLRHFDGITKFYIAIVNVQSDFSVQLAVDTKARDAATLAQVITRQQEGQNHPARTWFRDRKKSNVNANGIQWNKKAGLLFTQVSCPANQWTVFPVIAGQSGQVGRIRIQVESPCEFAVAVTAKETNGGYWDNKVPDPFTTGPNPWTTSAVANLIDAQRGLLGAWGDVNQPCGYWQGQKTDASGKATGDPITGEFLDAGGFSYFTFDRPLLYVAVYPKAACTIAPQRILWASLQPAA